MDVPSIRLGGGELGSDRLAAALEAFGAAGCVLLEDVVDLAAVSAAHDAFLARYAAYLEERDHEDALAVAPRRYMVTLRVEPPFTVPTFSANPFVLPLLTELLGQYHVYSYGCVVSLPGAPDQTVHRDTASLFRDDAVDLALPPYAISALIPLVDMDPERGTTRLWPGSHREPGPVPDPSTGTDPVVPRGSILLTDYRLRHSGTQNRSGAPRPLLFIVYARPWFRDTVNYRKQSPLLVDEETLESLPPVQRAIFPDDIVV